MAQSKVPKFGSWENGDVGYTAYFEVARKGNTGGPIINPNDIQMNRDVPRNAPNPKPQKQQQAKFGAWNDGEDVPYTQVFENKGKKTNPNEPQMNRDVGPIKQHPKQKQQHQPPPKFGAWEGADEVPYTQIFENKAKPNPNPNPNSKQKEPQMNRDVGHTRQSQEPQPKPQGVKFLDNKPKQPQPSAPRPQSGGGRGGASVPVFGGWNNNDTTQAVGYTVVFEKLHEGKKNANLPNVPNLPTHNNNNNRHNPPAHNNNNNRRQKQGGCFSWLLG